MNDLELAILFHHAYERLAPSVGYDTRVETRIFDPESLNGKLMLAVCAEILPLFPHPPAPSVPLTDADLWCIWNCAVGAPNHETFKGCCRAVLAAQAKSV